jgi:hypothetical protein
MCESSKSSLYHIYLLHLKKMSVPGILLLLLCQNKKPAAKQTGFFLQKKSGPSSGLLSLHIKLFLFGYRKRLRGAVF